MEARNTKISRLMLSFVTAALPLLFIACGTTSSSSGNPQMQNGNLNIVMQNGSTEDWATIGVKVLSISQRPREADRPSQSSQRQPQHR
jgi:hypothetical protein